jgi:hypothetical protein
MRVHRWWLSLIAAFLSPWPGPHVDAYVPIAWALVRARGESPDIAFWIIAGTLVAAAYLVWWLILSGIAAWMRRPQGKRDDL